MKAHPNVNTRGLKRGNTVGVGRKPKAVRDLAASVFTPEGFAVHRKEWREGKLEASKMKTLAQMGGLLIDQKDLRFPDGLPPQRVIHLFPPKGPA